MGLKERETDSLIDRRWCLWRAERRVNDCFRDPFNDFFNTLSNSRRSPSRCLKQIKIEIVSVIFRDLVPVGP